MKKKKVSVMQKFLGTSVFFSHFIAISLLKCRKKSS